MQAIDIDAAIENFRAGASSQRDIDSLTLQGWSESDWRNLFRFTNLKRVAAGREVIQLGAADRSLFFVMAGKLEVVVYAADGVSIGSANREGAGTVLGELAFFDGGNRSASVWSVDECQIAVMAPEQFAAFERAHPECAHDLVFELGRLLAVRLRRATPRATPTIRSLRAHDPFIG